MHLFPFLDKRFGVVIVHQRLRESYGHDTVVAQFWQSSESAECEVDSHHWSRGGGPKNWHKTAGKVLGRYRRWRPAVACEYHREFTLNGRDGTCCLVESYFMVGLAGECVEHDGHDICNFTDVVHWYCKSV